MTNLLVRILLSIMLLPLAVLLYVGMCFLMLSNRSGRSSEDLAFTLATLITAAFVSVYWLRLWRDSVSWTRSRIMLTLLCSAVCIVGGLIAAAILGAVANINDMSFVICIGGITAMICWLPVTVLIWKETAAERVERLRHAAADVVCCPRCGYNMTGLHEARCPECGCQFTLNQLYASQQRNEIADATASNEEQ